MPSSEDIAQQQTLLATYRRTLAHYLMQQAILGGAYTSPGVAHGIAEARAEIKRIKQVLRAWRVSVDDLPDAGDGPVLTSTTGPSYYPIPIQQTSIDRVKLPNVLTEYFNDDEICDLCFELNIDIDNLPGTTKAANARNSWRMQSEKGYTIR